MSDMDAPKKEIDVELGIANTLPIQAWGKSYFALNSNYVSLDELIHMRRHDGQAQALIRLVTLPIRLALQTGKWIEPEEGDAEEETEFANLMWTLPPHAGGMTTPATKLIRQILLSVSDGFSPFEVVRTIPEVGPLKGKITLRKLAYRDPRTIKIKVDDKGGYAGFKQTVTKPNGELLEVELEPLKTVVFTQQDELNPFYGISFFESCYPHYDAKRKLYYICQMAAQFAAVPGRLGTIPQSDFHSPKSIASFKKALADFSFNTTMVMKEGYKVEPFNNNSGFDFLKYIDHHNGQMSKAVLANFFDEDQRTVLIENTTQDASTDIFLLAMETIAEDIADVLTQHLMPQFIDLNFTSKKYPVFKPGPLSQANREAIRNMFDKLVTSGILNSTPELVRELEKEVASSLGLDIDYVEIEKREKEAAEAQQQAEQLQQQMQATRVQPEGGEEQESQQPPTPQVAEPAQGTPAEEEVAQLTRISEVLSLAADRLGFNNTPVDSGI